MLGEPGEEDPQTGDERDGQRVIDEVSVRAHGGVQWDRRVAVHPGSSIRKVPLRCLRTEAANFSSVSTMTGTSR